MNHTRQNIIKGQLMAWSMPVLYVINYLCIFPTKEVRSIVYLYVILLLPGFVQHLKWLSELAHPRISNCCGQLYKVGCFVRLPRNSKVPKRWFFPEMYGSKFVPGTGDLGLICRVLRFFWGTQNTAIYQRNFLRFFLLRFVYSVVFRESYSWLRSY